MTPHIHIAPGLTVDPDRVTRVHLNRDLNCVQIRVEGAHGGVTTHALPAEGGESLDAFWHRIGGLIRDARTSPGGIDYSIGGALWR